MEIYFSPELFKENAQVLNVVTQNNNPVGYLAFLMEENKMYVYGHLQEEGVTEDFKDLVKPYIQGLTKMKQGLEVFLYLSVGGKQVEVGIEKEKE
ncbi:MAG: hypothetical protein LRY73_19965 [Bacillus sp. (in: Bacteria)]|nr:hypothetical protein [Bacillus sp. (in: firmicutes)]